METIQIREKLHEFIDRADERILNLIYGMMEADNTELLTAEQQQDLSLRIARHKSGESKSFTWPETRAQILKK